jgi:hypothetical protein
VFWATERQAAKADIWQQLAEDLDSPAESGEATRGDIPSRASVLD